jgi:hypothetical protein
LDELGEQAITREVIKKNPVIKAPNLEPATFSILAISAGKEKDRAQ